VADDSPADHLIDMALNALNNYGPMESALYDDTGTYGSRSLETDPVQAATLLSSDLSPVPTMASSSVSTDGAESDGSDLSFVVADDCIIHDDLSSSSSQLDASHADLSMDGIPADQCRYQLRQLKKFDRSKVTDGLLEAVEFERELARRADSLGSARVTSQVVPYTYVDKTGIVDDVDEDDLVICNAAEAFDYVLDPERSLLMYIMQVDFQTATKQQRLTLDVLPTSQKIVRWLKKFTARVRIQQMDTANFSLQEAASRWRLALTDFFFESLDAQHVVDCLELTHYVGKSAAHLVATHILAEIRTFVRAKRMRVSSALLNKYALVSVSGNLAVQQARACNKDIDKLRSKPLSDVQRLFAHNSFGALADDNGDVGLEHVPSFDTFRTVIGTLVKHNPATLHNDRCTDMITAIRGLMGEEGYLHGLSSNPDRFIDSCKEAAAQCGFLFDHGFFESLLSLLMDDSVSDFR